ncbi:conserved protein, unknown function [Hepatocystis sp. ex Piliocolobus tephrosceles]|nr:conserved protein, unknown function [Hepatocystis sp. ex Piliocolobus tephrosceles]
MSNINYNKLTKEENADEKTNIIKKCELVPIMSTNKRKLENNYYTTDSENNKNYKKCNCNKNNLTDETVPMFNLNYYYEWNNIPNIYNLPYGLINKDKNLVLKDYINNIIAKLADGMFIDGDSTVKNDTNIMTSNMTSHMTSNMTNNMTNIMTSNMNNIMTSNIINENNFQKQKEIYSNNLDVCFQKNTNNQLKLNPTICTVIKCTATNNSNSNIHKNIDSFVSSMIYDDIIQYVTKLKERKANQMDVKKRVKQELNNTPKKLCITSKAESTKKVELVFHNVEQKKEEEKEEGEKRREIEEEKKEEKTDEKIEEKTDEKIEEKTDEKIEEKTDEKIEEKMEDKVEEKMEEEKTQNNSPDVEKNTSNNFSEDINTTSNYNSNNIIESRTITSSDSSNSIYSDMSNKTIVCDSSDNDNSPYISHDTHNKINSEKQNQPNWTSDFTFLTNIQIIAKNTQYFQEWDQLENILPDIIDFSGSIRSSICKSSFLTIKHICNSLSNNKQNLSKMFMYIFPHVIKRLDIKNQFLNTCATNAIEEFMFHSSNINNYEMLKLICLYSNNKNSLISMKICYFAFLFIKNLPKNELQSLNLSEFTVPFLNFMNAKLEQTKKYIKNILMMFLDVHTVDYIVEQLLKGIPDKHTSIIVEQQIRNILKYNNPNSLQKKFPSFHDFKNTNQFKSFHKTTSFLL